MLADRGYDVRASGEGAAAMTALASDAAALVLCAPTAVDGTGRNLVDALAIELPEVAVIVVTDDPDLDEVLEMLRLGASDYLTDVLADDERLVAAVEEALERTRLRSENSLVKLELEAANEQLQDYVDALQQDQRAGRQVQLGMLPPSPMKVDNLRLAHRIVPSLFLSGDFVDYFRLTERHLVFYIADVSGHGASSAFVTVLLKNFSRRLRREYRPRMLGEPGEILRWLNRELLESALDRHVTLFIGVVDTARQTLSCANAGHFPAPVLVTGSQARYLELKGKPLGLFEELRLASETVELPEEFTLALFSDGIFEVLAPESLAERETLLLGCVERCARETPGDLDALCGALGIEAAMDAPDDIACLQITRRA